MMRAKNESKKSFDMKSALADIEYLRHHFELMDISLKSAELKTSKRTILHVMLIRNGKRLANYYPSNGMVYRPGFGNMHKPTLSSLLKHYQGAFEDIKNTFNLGVHNETMG